MKTTDISTPRLKLILETLEEARAGVDAMPDEYRAEMSDEWLAMLAAATVADPWVLGFKMVCKEGNAVVGQVAFKGPPSAEGVVEIAYCVEPDQQGQGFATEAVESLTCLALQDQSVRLVRAHTLPEENASTRVLTKCGYRKVGEVNDPDDGLVWRWERGVSPQESS